jgi:hypothetical protein
MALGCAKVNEVPPGSRSEGRAPAKKAAINIPIWKVIAATSPLLPLACLYFLRMSLIDQPCAPSISCPLDVWQEHTWKEYIVPLWLDILVSGVAIALGSLLQKNQSGQFIITMWFIVAVINVSLVSIPPKFNIHSIVLAVFLPAAVSYLAAALTSIKAFEAET